MKRKKKGISLIVLIITIIIVIILAAVVIITMSKNNPINSAREARFKEDIRNFQSELSMYIGNQIVKDYSGTREKITTTDSSTFDEMKEYILSFQEKYEGKLAIEKDELVYFPKKVTKEEEKWLIDLGIKSKTIKETAESEFQWGSEDPNNSEYGTIIKYKGNSSNVVIPERCTKIEMYSFYGYSDVENITLTKNVRFLSGDFGDKLISIDVVEDNPYFYSEDGILFNKSKTALIRYPEDSLRKEYIIPDSVTTLATCAFYGCDNIENIIMPNTILKIEENAIESCDNLKSIEIPESVTDIAQGLNNASNFSYCESLTDINVSKNNKNYSSEEGILFDKNKTKLLKFPSNKNISNYKIPDSVTIIAEHAFENCKNIDSVIIPDSVINIGFSCFYQSSLKSIVIPNNVKSIKWKTFRSCTNLTEVVLSEGLDYIDGEAFYGCTNLIKINLPDSLSKIYGRAFEQCENLEKIILPTNLSVISSNAFQACNKLTFYCRIKEENKPSGWANYWNNSRPIVWEYTGD